MFEKKLLWVICLSLSSWYVFSETPINLEAEKCWNPRCLKLANMKDRKQCVIQCFTKAESKVKSSSSSSSAPSSKGGAVQASSSNSSASSKS